MFRWLKGRAFGSFTKSDTKKVLRSIVGLPADVQRSCAQRVLDEISAAAAELEKTPGPGHDLDEVIKKQLERAKASRHQALREGARDHSDPSWAAAALVESWLMANTGKFGRSTFEVVHGLIMGWVQSTLTEAEIEAAEHRAAKGR